MRHVYRVTEVVGTSSDGIDEAIEAAVERASETLRKLEWFEVTSIRGSLNGGQIAEYQVTLKVGFRLESSHVETGLMDFAPGPDPD